MMYKECTIVDSVNANLAVTEREARRIQLILATICSTDQIKTFILFGRALNIVHSQPNIPTKGTTFSYKQDMDCIARIVLASPRDPSQLIFIEYDLRRSSYDGQYALIATFNPTTLVAGNNVHPAAAADASTGEFYKNPSSAPRVVKSSLRMGYDVLEEIYSQEFNGQTLFDNVSRYNIERGDFRLFRVQWACYLPSKNPSKFLQFMSIVYGQTIAYGSGIIKIAEYLGLDFQIHTDERTKNVTGVTLRKLHGKKPVFSVVPYNKATRVAYMRQLGTLNKEEAYTVNNYIRLDITAQPQGIREICKAAQRKMRKEDLECIWKDEFIKGDPEPTAKWLKRAIQILALEISGNKSYRRSFGIWLSDYALKKVIYFDVSAGFSENKLKVFLKLDDPVGAAWKRIDALSRQKSLIMLIKMSKLGKKTVYNRRAKWLTEYGIDIFIPYSFYRDILYFGPNSLSGGEARGAIMDAVKDGDGDKVITLLRRAAGEFRRERKAVLGSVVGAPLHRMTVKELGPLSPTKAVVLNEAVVGLALKIPKDRTGEVSQSLPL